MTLRKQLIFVITASFLILFAGSFTTNVRIKQNYLNEQLQTISQDSATLLGLTLSTSLTEMNVVLIETKINVLFDSGYYSEITVRDMNGEIMAGRSDITHPTGVPGWFIKLFPLETPHGTSNVMSGWTQAGTIYISVNPEFAYVRLWEMCFTSLSWFAVAFVLTFGMVLGALHFVLRPLRAVELQAEAISNQDYVIQEKLPRTPEMRRVVVAMNQMSSRIRDAFTKQQESLERYHKIAYTDSVTDLANRSFFNQRFSHLLEEGKDFEHATLLFLEVANLQAVNNQLGHRAGDELLRGVAALIQSQIGESGATEVLIARLSGPTFAIALSGITEAGSWEFANKLAQGLPSLFEENLAVTDEIGHIGFAYRSAQSAQQLMSEADMALRRAQMLGKNAVYAYPSDGDDAIDRFTATQWLTLLRDVLENRRHSLFLQSTFESADTAKIMHSEVLLRIFQSDGSIIKAGVFIPLVNNFALASAFDRMVIEEVIERLERPDSPRHPIAINLMQSSVADFEFVNWLTESLKAKPQIAARMRFELNDYTISQNPFAVQVLANQIMTTEAKIGIEHFGRGNTTFAELTHLNPAYLQIDGSFTRDIDQNRVSQQFVESTVIAAQSLNIPVIAEFIETEAELQALKNLRVDGVRGHFLSVAKLWEKG